MLSFLCDLGILLHGGGGTVRYRMWTFDPFDIMADQIQPLIAYPTFDNQILHLDSLVTFMFQH